jgi:hypothetical protein
MQLRGATADLEDALTSKNLPEILQGKIRLAETISSYDTAKGQAPKCSFISSTYILLGDDSKIAAHTIFETASYFLRSHVKAL